MIGKKNKERKRRTYKWSSKRSFPDKKQLKKNKQLNHYDPLI